jgi:hypothetical protein
LCFSDHLNIFLLNSLVYSGIIIKIIVQIKGIFKRAMNRYKEKIKKIKKTILFIKIEKIFNIFFF